ncbi:MAG TPA: hypothetical protein VD907_06055 [Verrucomicrobiae bacterium]|nr:hypothetical protein [Verrucomicrobiae bacterium]
MSKTSPIHSIDYALALYGVTQRQVERASGMDQSTISRRAKLPIEEVPCDELLKITAAITQIARENTPAAEVSFHIEVVTDKNGGAKVKSVTSTMHLL